MPFSFGWTASTPAWHCYIVAHYHKSTAGPFISAPPSSLPIQWSCLVHVKHRLRAQFWACFHLLREAQDAGNFSQAFWLCAQSCQWMSELGKVHVAPNLTASVNGLYEETTRWLEGAMQALCTGFKPERMSKVGWHQAPPMHGAPHWQMCVGTPAWDSSDAQSSLRKYQCAHRYKLA